MATDNRLNRRATTDGRAIIGNTVYDLRILVEGVGRSRSIPLHYRRRVVGSSRLYTGPASEAWKTVTGR